MHTNQVEFQHHDIHGQIPKEKIVHHDLVCGRKIPLWFAVDTGACMSSIHECVHANDDVCMYVCRTGLCRTFAVTVCTFGIIWEYECRYPCTYVCMYERIWCRMKNLRMHISPSALQGRSLRFIVEEVDDEERRGS